MVRLTQMTESMRSHLMDLPCPHFDTTPWEPGPEMSEQRVAILSTAGLHKRLDRPFQGIDGDYRVIPKNIQANELVMTHVSTNFDRTGFQLDWNVVFPLDRLHELAQEGIINSVADYHYSFMGAADPSQMASDAKNLVQLLRGDGVNTVFLVPV